MKVVELMIRETLFISYNYEHIYPSIADQMWCLARLLPFMVDLIPTDDEHWLNFLAFLTIIDYVFAPVVSPDIVAFLHDKICSHFDSCTQSVP